LTYTFVFAHGNTIEEDFFTPRFLSTKICTPKSNVEQTSANLSFHSITTLLSWNAKHFTKHSKHFNLHCNIKMVCKSIIYTCKKMIITSRFQTQAF